jgi:uncharacterized OB-fold protein
MSGVVVHRCRNAHEFFHAYDSCPSCGGSLEAVRSGARAVLLTATTVRVNPSGEPFRLGLVRLESGAGTLCIVGDERLRPGDHVTLSRQDSVYHAVRP